MLLLVDNYDSFTYNLYQYLSELGAEVVVRRNDETSLDEIAAMQPTQIVVSPGPCTPNEAGLSCQIIATFGRAIPTLGVCLGHQAIGQVYGGHVIRAPEPMHGKTSLMYHHGRGIFANLPQPFEANRYHSLIVERETLPPELEITAETTDGLIMGLRHRVYPVEGVQFHPESILTPIGKDLLHNFLVGAQRGQRISPATIQEGSNKA
jgi:anthranilate synthase/aminodeoxychorismate synthase-like glutamine amidotransferase